MSRPAGHLHAELQRAQCDSVVLHRRENLTEPRILYGDHGGGEGARSCHTPHAVAVGRLSGGLCMSLRKYQPQLIHMCLGDQISGKMDCWNKVDRTTGVGCTRIFAGRLVYVALSRNMLSSLHAL